MAYKKVRVKATRRNGKMVKAHTRTVKCGTKGSGKEMERGKAALYHASEAARRDEERSPTYYPEGSKVKVPHPAGGFAVGTVASQNQHKLTVKLKDGMQSYHTAHVKAYAGGTKSKGRHHVADKNRRGKTPVTKK